MIKTITLTEDHLKLLSLVEFSKVTDEELVISKENPYILLGRFSDLAMALGFKDKGIVGTEEDVDGMAFLDEVEDYVLGVHNYILDNFYEIEIILHQYILKGGVTPGVYTSLDETGIWEKKETED